MATKNKVKGAAPSGPAKEKTKQAFAAAKPADSGKKAKGEAPEPERPKRALGLRGAAPWAARHAAKHAAEARKRAAEPPPPGSARATIRTPTGVEEIKAKIGELHNATEKIRSLRKNLAKSFFDIGLILREIQQRQLFAAKHFQSFEAFVEREVDLGKTTALRLVKLVGIFQKEAALEMGMDKAMEALVHLEGGETAKPASETRLPAAKPVMSSTTKGPIVGRLEREQEGGKAGRAEGLPNLRRPAFSPFGAWPASPAEGSLVARDLGPPTSFPPSRLPVHPKAVRPATR